MITTSITPTSQHVLVEFDVPPEYVGQDLEVMVQPRKADDEAARQAAWKALAGSLSNEDYLSLKAHTEQARKEWDRDF